MKRLFLILLLTMAPVPALSWEVIGSGITTADYCADKLGSYSLYYDADHPTSTTTACVSGGTATVSATTGVTTNSTDANMTTAGTYGVLWDGALNHYLSVPSTGMSSASGRIESKFKNPTLFTTSASGLWEWVYDSSNRVYARLQYSATGYLGGPGYRLSVVYQYSGTAATATTSYVPLANGDEILIAVDWNTTIGNIVGYLNGTATSTTPTIAAFSNEPTNPVRHGEDTIGASPLVSTYLDNIKQGPSQR